MASQPSDDKQLSVHLPSGAEIVVPLTGEDVTVGKAEKNLVVVDDPAVSSMHALFRRTGEDWMIVDLASRNGVYVNGHRIKGSCVVRQGDAVQIGHCHISLRSAHVAPAPKKAAAESGGKSKKRDVRARATYIKVGGALLAKIIGPIATLIIGLLLSGHFILSCGRGDDSGSPAEHRIAAASEPSVAGVAAVRLARTRRPRKHAARAK